MSYKWENSFIKKGTFDSGNFTVRRTILRTNCSKISKKNTKNRKRLDVRVQNVIRYDAKLVLKDVYLNQRRRFHGVRGAIRFLGK